MSALATNTTDPSIPPRRATRRRLREIRTIPTTFPPHYPANAAESMRRLRTEPCLITGKVRDSVLDQFYPDKPGEDAGLVKLGDELIVIWRKEEDAWDAWDNDKTVDADRAVDAVMDEDLARVNKLLVKIYRTPAKTIAGHRVKALAYAYVEGIFDLNLLTARDVKFNRCEWPQEELAKQALYFLLKGENRSAY